MAVSLGKDSTDTLLVIIGGLFGGANKTLVKCIPGLDLGAVLVNPLAENGICFIIKSS